MTLSLLLFWLRFTPRTSDGAEESKNATEHLSCILPIQQGIYLLRTCRREGALAEDARALHVRFLQARTNRRLANPPILLVPPLGQYKNLRATCIRPSSRTTLVGP